MTPSDVRIICGGRADRVRRVAAVIALASLGACGSDGDGFGGNNGGNTDVDWVSGVFLPAATFQAHCVAPRSGTNPQTGLPYADVGGTVVDENNFLRSYSNDTYLWYDEIVDRNPALYATDVYFDLLVTEALTPSGNPKDKFHFSIPTDEWLALSGSGESAGYGATWALLSTSTPRQVVVAYTDPGTPATAPGADLARGAEIVTVDGVDVVNGTDVDALNDALFPADAGETHTFTVRDLGSATTRTFSMQSQIVTSTPVQNVKVIPTPTGNVGYLVFNDHIATAEKGLYDAVTELKSQNITDLIVDIRYNGGGFLAIASEFAYMIAGPAQTAGQTFESLEFNAKHPSTNPVTGEALGPDPFYSTTLGFSMNAGVALPSLDLPRVFVLTGPGTCSASESVMNSLRGVDVEVIQIGATTCGKPYGFYPTDNCGTTYFTIQFRGENAKGFGDYTDGFSPANAVTDIGTVIPGCAVEDDFGNALGDAAEARLAAALDYRETGACPAPVGLTLRSIPGTGALVSGNPVVPKSQWRQNRIVGR